MVLLEDQVMSLYKPGVWFGAWGNSTVVAGMDVYVTLHFPLPTLPTFTYHPHVLNCYFFQLMDTNTHQAHNVSKHTARCPHLQSRALGIMTIPSRRLGLKYLAINLQRTVSFYYTKSFQNLHLPFQTFFLPTCLQDTHLIF